MRYNYDLDDTSVNPRKIITGILITLIEIAIVVLVAFLIVRYGLERMTMSGNGMEPTVKDDDSILINKMSYKLHSVKRNDVVVLRQNGSEHNYYVVQRVIGLPGETVEVIDGKVYINGSDTPLDEPYLPEPMEGSYGPYEVPEGCYFMMGDNRNNSLDARFWDNKFVAKNKIVAKVLFCYYPFNRIGKVD